MPFILPVRFDADASFRAPVYDTVSVVKRDLKAGERHDGMGGFTYYGLVDSYENCRKEDALPTALSLDCILKRDIAKDAPISHHDVELPSGRLCDTLRAEQTAHFEPTLHAAAA
jgi:predicted homoserine dehydrogenase-like protein